MSVDNIEIYFSIREIIGMHNLDLSKIININYYYTSSNTEVIDIILQEEYHTSLYHQQTLYYPKKDKIVYLFSDFQYYGKKYKNLIDLNKLEKLMILL
jgi:hypothetical protein